MGLTRPKVGIIGGSGRMGSWLTRLLERQGLTVLIAGRKTDLTPAGLSRQCDVVVISVPVADTVRIIKKIGPSVSEKGLLMDLASVKKGPVEAMLKYSRAQVVGVHPLFGPGTESQSGLRIALCPGRGQSGLNWIKGIFLAEGFRISVIEPEKHDRMMGLIQGVNHFSNLTFALCIGHSGFELEDLEDLSTQTFIQRLDRIRSIMEQPAGLFGSLLMDNPAAGEFIEQYLESMKQLIRITQDGDKKAFGALFESLKKIFIPERSEGASHHERNMG
ncbi:MAG: prephenate dehydrogenase/arogenate dehydrogenase family protein [Desulfatiglandales bacterium]|jgi:prephenate dehydrogenase|nr:prephenate dehydrogenase/arogenate dehydrogenase family protein [Desulfatiglandales bacterium]